MNAQFLDEKITFKQLQRALRYGSDLLSRRTLSSTVQACGLALTEDKSYFTIKEALYIAIARTLIAVEGWSYNDLKRASQSNNIELDLGANICSIQDIESLFQTNVINRMSKTQLASEYRICTKAVFDTLRAIGVSTKRNLYSKEDCEKFALAREYLDEFKISYAQVGSYLEQVIYNDIGDESINCPCYTKRDLSEAFSISPKTVRRTLVACGLSTKQRAYSKTEYLCFQNARQLIDDGNLSYNSVYRKYAPN